MKEKRFGMGATVHGKHVVVAGGNRQNTLNTAETYNFATDEWRIISPLNQKRQENELVSCEGSVYALGGKDAHNNVFSTVERLQDVNGLWRHVTSMQTPRHSFAAVTLNGMIYAIGGQSHVHHSKTLKSVERYDCAANIWSYVKEMNSPRFGHSACIFNGKILVVGGRKENFRLANKIECYDPDTDTWEIVSVIGDELWDHSIVSL